MSEIFKIFTQQSDQYLTGLAGETATHLEIPKPSSVQGDPQNFESDL